MLYNLLIIEVRRDKSMPFLRALAQSESYTISFNPFLYNDNRYTTNTPHAHSFIYYNIKI